MGLFVERASEVAKKTKQHVQEDMKKRQSEFMPPSQSPDLRKDHA